MSFQIIVTTQDKFVELVKLFDSLIDQNEVIEVIFVNQTGIDLSEFYQFSADADLFSIIEIKSPKCSLSKARNKALTHIRPNNIVAFADDDCWYSPNLLGEVATAFREHDFNCVCVNVFDPGRNKYLGDRPTGRKKVGLRNIFSLPISKITNNFFRLKITSWI